MATAQVELGDAAAILPGYAVKARVEHEPDGRFQLIQGKHLTPGDPYRFKPADRLRITGSRNAQAYQVHAGDILLASRGPSNYIVPIESVPEPTIAPATFYIVRPDLHTDGRYLAWLLQQPLLQAAMARMRGGRRASRTDAARARAAAPARRRDPTQAPGHRQRTHRGSAGGGRH